MPDIKVGGSEVIEGTKQLDFLKAELSRLERRGELPTEQSMHKARKHRDHGWSLVLADWKGDGCKEEFIPGTPLRKPSTNDPQADSIADQLRERGRGGSPGGGKTFPDNPSRKAD